MIEKNKKSNDGYEEEINNTLKHLKEQNNLSGLEYFFNLSKEYFDLEKLKTKTPKVIVLGPNIPEEIILALGEIPHYIIGGSFGSCSWSDSYVPRDTDSVNRSILGFLKNEYIADTFKDSLIVVPIVCDSMRKIAYILEDDFNVVTVDFPPDKDSKYSIKKWQDEMYKLRFALEKHLGKKTSKNNLFEASELVSNAREIMRKFVEISNEKNIISKTTIQFVLNTYYFATDIELWTKKLEILFQEIKSKSLKYNVKEKANVLVMGSPIYFPNFKIPFLLEDINLEMGTSINIITQKMMMKYDENRIYLSKDKLFEYIVKINYEKDCSQAYTNNKTLFDLVEQISENQEFDGVIYHVLKGQIEYDFELERYETLFAKKDIPIFRLETDYNYQDIEQLRIRMEAFMEMIQHRLYQNRRVVS